MKGIYNLFSLFLTHLGDTALKKITYILTGNENIGFY